ncbi:restriction endonuclease subunit S [Nostoc sp.]|uniref:restriction endonuclease subunit S n=1 Tax=Nostoc sp. TaxID=1180 RepID=UPI002FF4F410
MKWLTVKLQDILEDAISGTWGNAPVGTDSDYPVLRSTNIYDRHLSLEDVAFRAVTTKVVNKYALKSGDILVTTSSGSIQMIGKNALFKHPQDGYTYLFSNFTYRLRPLITFIIPEFLHLYLNSQRAKSKLIRIQNTTTGLRNLNTKLYLNQVIPLPSISEQRHIVEILEQADALQRMRAEADAKADRILPALFIKMFGEPSTWTDANTETLGRLVNIQSGGTPSKKNPDYWDGDIPWVSPKDMKQDIIFDSIDHISQKAIEETNIKYVEPGAILIVVRGMILAHTIPIALAATRLTINQDMKALYPNCNDIDSTYLHTALKASSRKILSQVGTAGHGTRKFDTDELLNLPILIPSQEQLKKFQIAVTECRASLAGISRTKEKLETLFNLLLQRAFSGELTAKWREAHIKELLAEMEEQAKLLKLETESNYKQLTL